MTERRLVTSLDSALDVLLAVCDDIVKYGELDTSGGAGMHRDLVEALRVFRALKRAPVPSEELLSVVEQMAADGQSCECFDWDRLSELVKKANHS